MFCPLACSGWSQICHTVIFGPMERPTWQESKGRFQPIASNELGSHSPTAWRTLIPKSLVWGLGSEPSLMEPWDYCILVSALIASVRDPDPRKTYLDDPHKRNKKINCCSLSFLGITCNIAMGSKYTKITVLTGSIKVSGQRVYHTLMTASATRRE